mmetsp:Transcript_8370/g.9512  ORF Transcript_8370/g.9512 Transcript_8370/m.9512 type:complete len:86 (-) Transcript_8370:15-272(-)
MHLYKHLFIANKEIKKYIGKTVELLTWNLNKNKDGASRCDDQQRKDGDPAAEREVRLDVSISSPMFPPVYSKKHRQKRLTLAHPS